MAQFSVLPKGHCDEAPDNEAPRRTGGGYSLFSRPVAPFCLCLATSREFSLENSSDPLGYWSRRYSGHLLPDTGLRSKTEDCGRDHFDYLSVSNLGHVAGNSTIARAGKPY